MATRRTVTKAQSFDPAEAAFWDLAGPLLATPGISRSTMMGYPCLRLDGRFIASFERTTGSLVIKLNAVRVQELITEGTGQVFAPNGRAFREWVVIPAEQQQRWPDFLHEAQAVAAGTAAPTTD